MSIEEDHIFFKKTTKLYSTDHFTKHSSSVMTTSNCGSSQSSGQENTLSHQKPKRNNKSNDREAQCATGYNRDQYKKVR